ncbi:aminoacetone oxidase family FAD-binding enzyme [bacterium]|nr:aminoacetone oxidase family FAD-binding enzyme [bacterium]
MAQESISKIGIIGGGPAGCFCAYQLQNNFEVTVFDYKKPLTTLLPTGGGRCNFTHYEFDVKELASNYPRGEKFLYSVFSRFSVSDTLEFFENIGVPFYVQEDMRVFPKSDSAADVREHFLSSLKKTKFKKERVLRINQNPLTVVTDMGSYTFDKVIIAVGGHNGYDCAKFLGHKIVEPKPALTALKTAESFKNLSGVSIKNVKACGFCDDILFTHEGISGPLVYKISSVRARDKFPYKISFDLVGEINLQEELNSNPHKDIKNLLSNFVPKSFAEYLLRTLKIDENKKSHLIDGKTRDLILDKLHNFEVAVTSAAKGGEVVTSGGVDLKEINPKTLESKIASGVYFCGEVLDIDGFCGGYNLQNCWSTAYCVSQSLINLSLPCLHKGQT